jgi:hypothetical protein
MASANVSARGQRAAILASPLSDLTGFLLAVDCPAPGCGGERTYAVSDLAVFYGNACTVGDMLRRMRCSGGCGGPVARDGADTQRSGSPSSCGVAGAGGEGVMAVARAWVESAARGRRPIREPREVITAM